MPTLIRMIVALLFLVGLGYGAMFALAVFVKPTQKQITVTIPASRFDNIAPEPEPQPAETSGSDNGQPPPVLPNESAPE